MSVEEFLVEEEAPLENYTNQQEFYLPEKYQLGILTDYLQRHGFDYITEGRIFCYPIDLLCVRKDTTVAIEMKSGNIQRGIDQAWRNSDFVDFSYLALWAEHISGSVLDAVSETPVGVLSVDECVKQVSPPRKTPKQLCSRAKVYTSVRSNVRDDTSLQ